MKKYRLSVLCVVIIAMILLIYVVYKRHHFNASIGVLLSSDVHNVQSSLLHKLNTYNDIGWQVHFAEGVAEKQVNQATEMIQSGVRGLLVMPVNVHVAEEIAQKANRAQIPLVLWQADNETLCQGQVYCIFSAREQNSLTQSAAIVDLWRESTFWDKNKDSVLQYLVIESGADNPSHMRRLEFFLRQSDIQVQRIDLIVGYWTREAVREELEKWFAQNPHQNIEMLIVGNNQMALGASDVLYQKKMHRPIVSIGLDLQSYSLLQRGVIVATLVPDEQAQVSDILQLLHNLIFHNTPSTHLSGVLLGNKLYIADVVAHPDEKL